MGVGLGRSRERGEGEGVGVCVRCVCVCVPVPPPLTEEQPVHRPRAPPPRTRRAFVASRWNTYAARRREAPSRTALAPTSRPSTSAESECTHRSASSRDGASAGSPVNASDAWACRHASTAWSSRTRGAWCRGQCRYICIVVSTAPVQVLQCARPAGPTLPYEQPASPPLVRACTCHLASAGGPLRYHARALPPCARRYFNLTLRWFYMFICFLNPLF